MNRPEESDEPDKRRTDAPATLPGFDFLSEWANLLGVARHNELAPKPTEQSAKSRINEWTVGHGGGKETDELIMTADYTVRSNDFYRQNPNAPKDLSQLKKDDRFEITHPTTGEVDKNWRVVASGNGEVRLQRDYSIQVKKGRHDGLIEALPGVSDQFVHQLKQKLEELPPNVRESLREAGYKIIAAPKITDAVPGLKGMTPRGWARTSSFDNSDGTHDNVSRRIIMPEFMKYDQDTWDEVSRPEVLTHQIGHALDFSNGFLSGKREFMEAFTRDTNNRYLDRNNHILKYFSQPDGAGQQEAFASLFGLALTGPENESDREYLEKTFPLTLEAVKRQIKTLGEKQR